MISSSRSQTAFVSSFTPLSTRLSSRCHSLRHLKSASVRTAPNKHQTVCLLSTNVVQLLQWGRRLRVPPNASPSPSNSTPSSPPLSPLRSTLPRPPASKPMTNDRARSDTPLLNRVLACRRLATLFIALAALFYLISLCLLARTIAMPSVALQTNDRIILIALSLLLPDFRHVVKSYSDAVGDLHDYRPPFVPFPFSGTLSSPSASSSSSGSSVSPSHAQPDAHASTRRDGYPQDGHGKDDDLMEVLRTQARAQMPAWLTNQLESLRARMDVETGKLDVLWNKLTADVSRPLYETSTQIRQLTSGTDLTLRKNVVLALGAVCLSVVGYCFAVAGEASVAGVAIMLAHLMPSVLLPRAMGENRHELLRLANDVRVIFSLVGTLVCVLSAFFPGVAAYAFLICCFLLVVSRYPMDWMRIRF